MRVRLESLVLCNDPDMGIEIGQVVSVIPHITARRCEEITEMADFLKNNVIQFIIVADDLTDKKDEIMKLAGHYPYLYFIYYYPQLNINRFDYSELTRFSHIIVGEHRVKALSEILLQLTRDYWKKIPYGKFDLVYDQMSPRLKRVMTYIESHDLKDCATINIAHHLEISPGYFSQEFKRETSFTFREFMQKLLDHYEFIILDSLNLSAKSASKILGYSELSSFSRSFKKRKGYPPSQRKFQKLAES